MEVHVAAPGGPLLSRTGPRGSAETGNWVHDGMVFFLQDVSGEKPLRIANTLDRIEVRARPQDRVPRASSGGNRQFAD